MKFSFLLPVAALSALLLSSCMHYPSQSPQPPETRPAPAPEIKEKPVPAPEKHPASGSGESSVSQIPARQLEILSTLPLGIIGGREFILLETIPNALPAKVDTGADTCSLHALNLKYFERDGRPWVSFQIQDPVTRKMHSFERRVKRRPKIKRHGAESVQRPVIEMKFRFGGQMMKCDFSLTDRSRFTYPVLIGQNLLNGRAAVDVSRNNLLGK